jgi:hypothetical protein
MQRSPRLNGAGSRAAGSAEIPGSGTLPGQQRCAARAVSPGSGTLPGQQRCAARAVRPRRLCASAGALAARPPAPALITVPRSLKLGRRGRATGGPGSVKSHGVSRNRRGTGGHDDRGWQLPGGVGLGP